MRALARLAAAAALSFAAAANSATEGWPLDEAAVREHAARGGFPANRVSRITAVIDPTTAE